MHWPILLMSSFSEARVSDAIGIVPKFDGFSERDQHVAPRRSLLVAPRILIGRPGIIVGSHHAIGWYRVGDQCGGARFCPTFGKRIGRVPAGLSFFRWW